MYYSDYYSLPARISLEKLRGPESADPDAKTAKALLELSDIELDDILNATDFEEYKAELEATQAIISDEMFRYWKTNQNLSIQFDVDKVEKTVNPNDTRVVEHILDVRVRNSRAAVSLPLKNRSRGFNWFFSFLVWFKRIQEVRDSPILLLLDEPGLNLHASAQADLLEFISDLSNDYQIVYTTHSPFMVEIDRFHSVRTVVETSKGTKISDSMQEKDPNTLFPLQAALGYDIAQNLFIAKKNLLVEGASDLVILEMMSSTLQEAGRVGLSSQITIVPVGGMDKVSTFISLLRGNKLEIVCALDTVDNQKTKDRLGDLERNKLIRSKNILFFDEFVNGVNEADIEDLFDENDYIDLFNDAFRGEFSVDLNILEMKSNRIVRRIAQAITVDRYNHYRPAHQLLKRDLTMRPLNSCSLDRFEELFKRINSLF